MRELNVLAIGENYTNRLREPNLSVINVGDNKVCNY